MDKTEIDKILNAIPVAAECLREAVRWTSKTASHLIDGTAAFHYEIPRAENSQDLVSHAVLGAAEILLKGKAYEKILERQGGIHAGIVEASHELGRLVSSVNNSIQTDRPLEVQPVVEGLGQLKAHIIKIMQNVMDLAPQDSDTYAKAAETLQSLEAPVSPRALPAPTAQIAPTGAK